MQQLQTGQHFGAAKKTLRLNGSILTEAGYVPRIEVPWHYHENAYFYYHLKGSLEEVNKKQNLLCSPGTLLFHHWQDPHYDKNFSTDARFFHIELEKSWFAMHHVHPAVLEGSMQVENPSIKSLFLKIHRASRINDPITQLAVDGLLLQSFAGILRHSKNESFGEPGWVKKVREILHDGDLEDMSLKRLAFETGIHPIHLSKEFPRYFNTGYGEYIRTIKVERAAVLLSNKALSLSGIAYQCGFADQSHFIRCFKALHGMTPFEYRRRLSLP